MSRREPPETAAGYYVLHDFRRIEWERWQALGDDERTEYLEETIAFFEDAQDIEDGDFGVYSVHGHKADLLLLVLKPTLRELDAFERSFAQLPFAGLTERTTSALGVTEASGYTDAAAPFFDPEEEADPGIERYMNARLYPTLPDADFLSFYFMDKRRDPDANWYDLPYEERVEHVSQHGEIGKEFAGSVTQLITGSIGFDDWEWGVTLFTEDMVAVKDLLTTMRFDPSTSKFAEFGPFYVADRFSPEELPAVMAGEAIDGTASEPADAEIPTIEADWLPEEAMVVRVTSSDPADEVAATVDDMRGNFDHYDSHLGTQVRESTEGAVIISGWETERAAETASGFLADLPGAGEPEIGRPGRSPSPQTASTGDETAESVRSGLENADVYAGQPHGEDVHALVRFSDASIDEIETELEPLREAFDRYDSHEGSVIYESESGERRAVVSLWDSGDAAERAAGYLEDLPGTDSDDPEAGFSTMGLFYRVKPEYRTDFVETFDDVGKLLADMDGHRGTDLLVNVEDDTDMFIASRWRDREDAMAFFRSEAFSDTVDWGRDVLADRPRHVFLA